MAHLNYYLPITHHAFSMLDPTTLAPLFTDAFSRQISFNEAASRYPIDEWIETFRAARAGMFEVLDGLTDAQAAYASPSHSMWSLSETFSHIAFSQALQYNVLLDQAPTMLPHMAEAPRGGGEGAKTSLPVTELRAQLEKATALINEALDATRPTHDPQRVVDMPIFGPVNYAGILFILVAHELDHLRQARLMRRLARAEAPAA